MGDSDGKIAIFWDESYLWGLIACETFLELELDFRLLTAADVSAGALDGCGMLFVPGGWASDKIRALGEAGADAIRRFVSGGGGYLGVCGGAGLALDHENGLRLLKVERMPTSRRLPSFSGTIQLRLGDGSHPLWSGVDDRKHFHAWWPGQFALSGEEPLTVLARYGAPGPDSFVTDLPVAEGMDWQRWEEIYGINLDPGRIQGEPAVIEGQHGEGRVLLSYLHFETPGDSVGHEVLLNAIDYLGCGRTRVKASGEGTSAGRGEAGDAGEAARVARELARETDSFIEFGMKNFLWYRRNPWLLHWRRGIRGIEYSTIAAMVAKIEREMESGWAGFGDEGTEELKRLEHLLIPFLEKARKLVMLERLAMNRGPLSPLRCEDPEIREMRSELFSSDRRCGGLYRQIVKSAAGILLNRLRQRVDG
jgi:hypothetical protein